MDTPKLGKLIQGEEHRDAVHIAIAPVVATEKLYPGQHIGFVGECREQVWGRSDKPLGIVDPFLAGPIFPGDKFFMFLYPQTITSLRHEWTHPAFASGVAPIPDKAASQKWMEEFAAKHHSHKSEYYDGFGRNYTADEVVEFAKEFLLTGHKHIQQGSESLRDYTNAVEFWPHFEVLTGMKVTDYHREETPFCCTC